MKEKRYVSIDLETTGLDPENCQILEIGAVIDDWESPIEGLPTFHCFVRHEQYHGEPYALWLNSKIFAVLGSKRPPEVITTTTSVFNDILSPENVGNDLVDWLRVNNMLSRGHITVAGKNFGSFDLQFLKRLTRNEQLTSIIRHRNIDPGNLYWVPNQDGASLPNLKTCLERAGIDEVVDHTAVDDARQVIKLIRHYFELEDKWRMR